MPHQEPYPTPATLLESRTRLVALVEQIDNQHLLDALFMLGWYAWVGQAPRQPHLLRLVLGGAGLIGWQWLA